MLCANDGLAALDAGATTSLVVFGFTPALNVVNAGGPTHLLLAIANCPAEAEAPLLLGSWQVWDDGGFLCLSADSSVGAIQVVNCDARAPTVVEAPRVSSFVSMGPTACSIGTNGCTTAPVLSVGYHAYAGMDVWEEGKRFTGATAVIEWQFVNSNSLTDHVSVWVAVANFAQSTDDPKNRWFQAGWRRFPYQPTTVYCEAKVTNEPALPPLEQDGVQVFGEYKVAYDEASASWQMYADCPNAANGYISYTVPASAVPGVRFCSVQFMAEVHNALDHVPGSTQYPLQISCCGQRLRGKGWERAVLSHAYDTAPNSFVNELLDHTCDDGLRSRFEVGYQ